MTADDRDGRQPGTSVDRRRVLAALGAAGTSSLAGCSVLSGSSGPSIDVADAARFDEALSVRVTEADPEASVTLEARMTDAEDNEWTASATLEADGEGVVSVPEQAPVEGAYGGPHPMGLVWSMTTDDGGLAFRHEMTSEYDLTITAAAGDRSTDETVSLGRTADGVTAHEIEADGIVGEWWEPAGEGPHPAVVVLHGSGGSRMVRHASTLASNGFAAMTFVYYGVEGTPSSLVEVPLGHVTDAIDWFMERDAIAGDSLGVYGVSKGAELALLLASRDDRISAVVSDSGSGYVLAGIDDGLAGTPSSWSVNGEQVPCIPYTDDARQRFTYRGSDVAYRDVFAAAVEEASEAEREAAAIPVEEGSARYLLLSGGDDQLWPAVELSNVAIDRLDAVGYDRPYEHLVYEDAGHSLNVPHLPQAWRPASGGIVLGGSQNACGKATADAWPRVLETLDEALR